MQKTRIVVLGSTGSIGTSTLSLVAEHPDRFEVAALTCRSNHSLLIEQVRRFAPPLVAVGSVEAAAEVRAACPGVEVLEGASGIERAATAPGADIVITAIVGAAGLRPTLAAVRAGLTVGLANKETLVVAGDVVMAEAQRSGARIIPVDSEHSAVFQCLEGRDPASVRRVILTASGGPFHGRAAGTHASITPADALKHPSWTMGQKITIDSATLMNKGLEVIEAHHLFGVGPEKIGVVIHPQSIVHSMVEFVDGSVLAQLSVPDMRGAIAYALTWPERLPDAVAPLDLARLGSLTFGQPDVQAFPCLGLAFTALERGGTIPAVLNAANEVAVDAFLSGRIGFTDIPAIIRQTMARHERRDATSLDAVTAAHDWAHAEASGMVQGIAKEAAR